MVCSRWMGTSGYPLYMTQIHDTVTTMLTVATWFTNYNKITWCHHLPIDPDMMIVYLSFSANHLIWLHLDLKVTCCVTSLPTNQQASLCHVTGHLGSTWVFLWRFSPSPYSGLRNTSQIYNGCHTCSTLPVSDDTIATSYNKRFNVLGELYGRQKTDFYTHFDNIIAYIYIEHEDISSSGNGNHDIFRVIDTPGMADLKMKPERAAHILGQVLSHCEEGIHAFLYVHNATECRYTEELLSVRDMVKVSITK